MVTFFKSLIVAITGIALGLFATWLSIEKGHGFGDVNAGPWIGWPRSGTAGAAPYARAAISRTGQVPLDLAEGLSFIAQLDSSGQRLANNCTYTILPPIPPARYWTVSLSTPEGQTITNDFDRTGLTSSEIFRTGSDAFSIHVSANVQPGNWLPLNRKQPFVLMLRLYDTPASASAASLKAADMPQIKRGVCS